MKRSPMPKRKKPLTNSDIYKAIRKLKECEIPPGTFAIWANNQLKKRKPLRRLSKKKAASRAAFRKAVMAKKGGLCAKCLWDANWLTPLMAYDNPDAVIRIAEHPHHWLPVGRGGTDDPSNGIPLCSECHRWIHDNPKQAHLDGWLLKANEAPNANAVKIREFMKGRE